MLLTEIGNSKKELKRVETGLSRGGSGAGRRRDKEKVGRKADYKAVGAKYKRELAEALLRGSDF